MTTITTATQIARIEIDAATTASASALQRAEWRVLAEDLASAGLATTSGASVLIVSRAGHLAAIRLEGAEGALATHPLDSSTLTALFDEYVGIVKMMIAEDVPLPRLEALDMAKKVVHDRAARTLSAEMPMLHGSAEAMRRLFSLVVALRVDPHDIKATRRHGR